MKKLLLNVVLMTLVAFAFGQSMKIEVPIVKTGEIVDEETGVTIAISTDDAEQENDAMDSLEDDDLDAGWEGTEGDANLLTTGLRFQNVTFQVSSTVVIDSAFIILHSHEGKSADDVAQITIYGENDANPETFDLESLITDRPATDASVMWEVAEEWEIWKPYNTPDLKDIVQELIDLDGYENGNDMVFVLAGEDQGESEVENAREFESFENISDPEDLDPDGNPGDGQNHPDRVPNLVVYYSLADDVAVAQTEVELFRAYPNPVVNGQLTISLSNDESAEVNVYDVTGKVFHTQLIDNSNETLNVGHLNAGIYLVKVTQNNSTDIQKIIIK